MFDNFLNDTNQYENCEKFWHALFEEINLKLQPERRWKPWFTSFSASGNKLLDGNPIFTRWHEQSKKAIRIIQEAPEFENEFHLGAWMDKFDDDIDELVISCVLSEETKIIIQQLIEIFVLNDITVESMQHEINNRLD